MRHVTRVMRAIFIGIALLASPPQPSAYARQIKMRAPSMEADPTPRCDRAAGSLPDPAAKLPINHIVVLMQENHSFDQYFGSLNTIDHYSVDLDGLRPDLYSLDGHGKQIDPYLEKSHCIADPNHGWDAEHASWNQGKNDRFAAVNGRRAMAYYDATVIPYYYALADRFAVADHYFCSALSPTYPNRFFLFAGTAFGHTANDTPSHRGDFAQKTLFDLLDEHGISWKEYATGRGYLRFFGRVYQKDRAKVRPVDEFETDLAKGTLPQVAFLESTELVDDEHPPADVRRGEAWVSRKVNALMASTAWADSALFLTYDENGGFYDHVPPPRACSPDGIGHGFDRYGFRVPLVAVSPFAKHHYVSHAVYDHSSILKFIETRFALPALTARDANADAMLDLFDFEHPPSEETPLPPFDYDRKSACRPAS